MSRPLNYQHEAYIQSHNMIPYEVRGVENAAMFHNKRYLYNVLYSVFDLGIPKQWKLGYVRFWTFHAGSYAVMYTREYGWVPMPYAIENTDYFFYPHKISGMNSHLKREVIGICGINCEIVYILDDLFGLDATVTEYASRLSNLDKAFDVNVMNTSFSNFVPVENDKQAQEVKRAYSRATMGSPIVPVIKNLFRNGKPFYFNDNPKQNFAANELHQARRGVVNDFLTEIGVRNANYDKKERLNSMEVSENNDQTSAQARVILKNLNDCYERVREVTDGEIDMTAKLEYNYELISGNDEGGENDVE